MTEQRRKTRELGQNLVEFALVVPLLTIFIFAVIEFGNLLRSQIELQNAVRDGARYASINYADGSLSTNVKTNAVQPAAVDLTPLTVTLSYPTACPSATAEVQVSATYSYNAITPIGSLITAFHGSFPNPDTLSATSKFHSEC